MTINGFYVDVYNAVLFGYDLLSTEISNSYQVFKDSPYFAFYQSVKALRPLSVRLWVEGVTSEDCDINISRILNLCSEQCVIKFNDTDLLSYDCVYQSNEIDKVNPLNKKITLTFVCVAREDIVSQTLTSSDKIINNAGTLKVPCIIKVKAGATALSNITVYGITITSIPADKTMIIDGIEGTVTIDGVNALLSTNLVEFPKLEVGNNTINFSTETDVVVEYYPTFI